MHNTDHYRSGFLSMTAGLIMYRHWYWLTHSTGALWCIGLFMFLLPALVQLVYLRMRMCAHICIQCSYLSQSAKHFSCSSVLKLSQPQYPTVQYSDTNRGKWSSLHIPPAAIELFKCQLQTCIIIASLYCKNMYLKTANFLMATTK